MILVGKMRLPLGARAPSSLSGTPLLPRRRPQSDTPRARGKRTASPVATLASTPPSPPGNPSIPRENRPFCSPAWSKSLTRGSNTARRRHPSLHSHLAHRGSDCSTMTRQILCLLQLSSLRLLLVLLPRAPPPQQAPLLRVLLGLWGWRQPRVRRKRERWEVKRRPRRESAARTPKRAPFPAQPTSFPPEAKSQWPCPFPRRPLGTRHHFLLHLPPLPTAPKRGRGEQSR